jgi:hypothetical protein
MKLSLVAALVLSTAPMIANAGIPVIDGASVAQSVLQVANGIQTIQSLQQSYAQMQRLVHGISVLYLIILRLLRICLLVCSKCITRFALVIPQVLRGK